MPSLSQSLAGRDLGYLRIVAAAWGGQLPASDLRSAYQYLDSLLLDPDQIEATLSGLPASARAALDDLLYNQGRLSWALFTRRYGTVREMGPGRRDRDQPQRNPASPAEVLWYRALVARSFFDGPRGPEEYAFVPDDLLALLPPPPQQAPEPLGRPATAAERGQVYLATDHLLDVTCTLLAAYRLELDPLALDEMASGWKIGPTAPSLPMLSCLLSCISLLDEAGQPQPEPVREFLEAGRGVALASLAQGWLHSDCNDLRQAPGLDFEGHWSNDPLQTRQAVLDFLSSLPSESWWSLASFVAAVKERHPDFQRSAGNYDSWYIKDAKTGEYLRGFEHWDAVEGALLRYLICGPLHWLGFLDLAAASPEGPVQAFRRSRWAEVLLRNGTPEGLPLEEGKILVRSDARLSVPPLTPRAARYQLARFCDWQGKKGDDYRYRITPGSLERARKQGLTPSHLLALLRRYTVGLPSPLVKALERWEQRGTEARLETLIILRVSSPEILQALRSSRAARFLGDPLSATAVAVRPGAVEKVQAILAEMGYLAELPPVEPTD